MRIFFKFLTTFLLLFILFTPPSTAEILSAKIRSDKCNMILFSKFRFSHSGYVSIAVSSVSFTSPFPLPPPDPSRLGFMLLPDETIYEYNHEFDINHDLCPLDNKFIKVLFTFQDLSSPNQSSFNKTYHVTYPNLYSLYFINCNVSHVSMDVHTELYNINDDGVTKSYLSAGQTKSPSLYFCYSYLSFLLLWILVCLKYRRSLHMVHLLMGVLLLISAFHFFVVCKGQHYVKLTGESHGWDTLFSISQFMRTEFLFMVTVLTCIGWGFWKPSLHVSDKLFLMIVILLEVCVNVVSIKLMESVPYINEDREGWFLSYCFADFFCGIVVSVGIGIIMTSSVAESNIQGNAMTACGVVFALWACYLTFIKFLLHILMTNYDSFPWVVNTADEVFILVICMVMFCIFRPFDDKDEKHCMWRSLDNELPT